VTEAAIIGFLPDGQARPARQPAPES